MGFKFAKKWAGKENQPFHTLSFKFEPIDYIDVQTVVFLCRHAAWQFPTPDIFPAVTQGLMLA
jgi:hypothetical protein